MARVYFREGQPIQSLSGTLGNLTYRTLYGRTFVRVARQPVLPEDATRAQKAKYKRNVIVNDCVSILQDEITDMQEAIAMRGKIRDRVMSLYKRYSGEIKAPTKLQREIMTRYRQKWCQACDDHDKSRTKPR